MAKSIQSSLVKAMSLCLMVSSLRGIIFGLERYHDAKASDILPGVSVPRFFSGEPTAERLHMFSMEILGSQGRYETFEVSFVDRGGEIVGRLRLKAGGKDTLLRDYERAVDEADFTQFWKALRELEVAHLTDLSPATEKLGDVSSVPMRRNTGSETLGIKFQDGLYDYPNSFRVYAPEALEDGRYLALRELTGALVASTFGDVLLE